MNLTKDEKPQETAKKKEEKKRYLSKQVSLSTHTVGAENSVGEGGIAEYPQSEFNVFEHQSCQAHGMVYRHGFSGNRETSNPS